MASFVASHVQQETGFVFSLPIIISLKLNRAAKCGSYGCGVAQIEALECLGPAICSRSGNIERTMDEEFIERSSVFAIIGLNG